MPKFMLIAPITAGTTAISYPDTADFPITQLIALTLLTLHIPADSPGRNLLFIVIVPHKLSMLISNHEK